MGIDGLYGFLADSRLADRLCKLRLRTGFAHSPRIAACLITCIHLSRSALMWATNCDGKIVGELLRDTARNGIHPAAGSERHDQPHRSVWIGRSLRRAQGRL